MDDRLGVLATGRAGATPSESPGEEGVEDVAESERVTRRTGAAVLAERVVPAAALRIAEHLVRGATPP